MITGEREYRSSSLLYSDLPTGASAQTLAEFSCEDGYYLEGQHRVHCNLMGQWQTHLPLCKPVYCGYPGLLENGQTSGLDYYYGDTIINSCNEGFTLDGPRSQTCETGGTWSGGRPQCRGNYSQSASLSD